MHFLSYCSRDYRAHVWELPLHMYGNCPYFGSTGQILCHLLGGSWGWGLPSLAGNFEQWQASTSLPLVALCIFLWEYGKARNDYIFQDVPIFQNAIISKVCSSPFLVLNSYKIASRRLINPPSEPRDMVTGYFDGAASVGICVVGMVLLVNNSQSYKFHMDARYGLNTRSKLLALWGLLHFSLHKNY